MKADISKELKRIEEIKKTLSDTKRILTMNLLISSLYVLLGFGISYWITVYKGTTILTVMFLMFGCVGFYFMAKALLGFQVLFENQQEARRMETELLEELEKVIDDNEKAC